MSENRGANAPWDPMLLAVASFRRVVAGHLAEMFLDSSNPEVHQWARAIAAELRRADVGIDDEIVSQLRIRTLGFDPEEPPF